MTRRRQVTARVLIALAIAAVAAIGVIVGRASTSSSHPGSSASAGGSAQATPITEPDGAWTCPPVADHTAEGAATTAMVGLYSMALTNLQSPASTPQWRDSVTRLLDRYVVAGQRTAMRDYLAKAQTALTAIAELPVSYQVVSYQPDVAVVRLLLADYGHRTDGTPTSSVGVVDATLQWDPTATLWRLASWPANRDPAVLSGLVGDGQFCHVASG